MMAHALDPTAVAPGDRVQLQPFLFEKHLHHQDGLAGTLSIRLLEARNLRAAASMFWVRTCNPYVIFRLGKQTARSTTIEGNDNPTWRRELHEMKIYKLVDTKRGGAAPAAAGDHSDVRLELIVDVMNEDSLTGRATEVVGMTNGSIIGTATIDFTPLLEGKEEVLDTWISLSTGMPLAAPAQGAGKKKPLQPEKELVLGEVRLVLQYEPHGMEPVVGDVVKLEGFGAYPSCLVAPLDELELTVKKISGSYLLCAYATKSGFPAALRLHRNNVFVAHRGSLLDRLYVRCVAEPLEFLGNTPLGQTARDYAKPYVNVARTFSLPALSAARATIWTTYKASTAAAGAILATMDQ